MMPPLYAAPLLSGDAGTSQTIGTIRGLVDDAWRDSAVRRFAFEILRNAGAQQYDRYAQALAIYSWVTQHTYFLNDPVNKEAVMPVSEMLKMYRETGTIPGDCDDINAILLPALLGAIGVESRLVTIAADDRDPSVFSHIYAEAKIDGAWLPLDAARPDAEFGLAPDSFYRRWQWSLRDGSSGPYADDGPDQLSGYLGDYSDPRVQSVVQGAIGPGGIPLAAAPTPSLGVNPKTLFGVAIGIGLLALLAGWRPKL